jgi:TolA-binding protein
VLVRHASLPDGVRRIERGGHVEIALEARAAVYAPAARASTQLAPRPAAMEVVDSAALLRRADEARRSDRLGVAIDALETIVARHPRSHEAPLAAFTLGRLEEDRGRFGQAARAYRRAVTLGLREPLREEAHARWGEAASRANDREGAREAAHQYEDRYPGGAHLARLRALGAE